MNIQNFGETGIGAADLGRRVAGLNTSSQSPLHSHIYYFLTFILYKRANILGLWLEIKCKAIKEIPKGELSFLTRNNKRLFAPRAKNLIEFVWLKTEIIHGSDQELSSSLNER